MDWNNFMWLYRRYLSSLKRDPFYEENDACAPQQQKMVFRRKVERKEFLSKKLKIP